jgi:hypothetical protein
MLELKEVMDGAMKSFSSKKKQPFFNNEPNVFEWKQSNNISKKEQFLD